MKRIIGIVYGMLLLSTISFAAGNVQIDVTVCDDDTIIRTFPASLQINIANDVQMGGFQIPLTLSSPDGVTWTWNSQLDGWGPHKYVTHNASSRIEPPATNFDLTNGVLVIENGLPNQIAFGGGVMFGPGMTPGPQQEMLAAHLTVTSPSAEDIRHLCVNVTQAIGATELLFTDINGMEMSVTFLDPNGDGIWCFPVYLPACKSLPTEEEIANASPLTINCGSSSENARCGLTYERTIVAENTWEECGVPMFYSISHTTDTAYHTKTPVNAPSIDAESGLFQWLPTETDTGLWVFTVGATIFCDPVECAFTIDPYVCGDANGDGDLNVGDAVFIVTYVFRGGPAPVPMEAGDANADGLVNIGDAVYLITHIFRDGPAPCN